MPLHEARELVLIVPDWTLAQDRLRREYVLRDFQAALNWIHLVGEIAEQEEHHPDLHVTRWNHVTIELWTHAVGGLHVNDFVLARRLDQAWEAWPA